MTTIANNKIADRLINCLLIFFFSVLTHGSSLLFQLAQLADFETSIFTASDRVGKLATLSVDNGNETLCG